VHHIYFTPSLATAFSAPVTEITTLYSPTASSEEDADAILSVLGGVKGYISISKAPVIDELGEDKVKACQLFIGWESVKAHEEAMKKSEVMARISAMIHGAKKVEMHHVKLTVA